MFKRFRLPFPAVKLYNIKVEKWSITPYESWIICALVKATNSKTVFEIGTFKGITTINIAENLPSNGKIYTLDINQHLKPTKKIIPIEADSKTFDFSPYFNKIDLFFIDGCHEYEYVLSDSINAFNCVKNGGFYYMA